MRLKIDDKLIGQISNKLCPLTSGHCHMTNTVCVWDAAVHAYEYSKCCQLYAVTKLKFSHCRRVVVVVVVTARWATLNISRANGYGGHTTRTRIT